LGSNVFACAWPVIAIHSTAHSPPSGQPGPYCPLGVVLVGRRISALVNALAHRHVTSRTHLALHAFIEARHTDDHTLMDAAADRLDLVARCHAERDSAAFHA
jgi:hypothetical protein